MRYSGWVIVAATGLLAASVIGCSDDSRGRERVSGEVTFKGRPLDQGSIQFIPTDPEQGTFSGSPIENGAYTIDRAKGLAPGTYRVVISSGEPGTKAEEEAPGESGPPAKERIPAKYNADSQVTVEVTRGGPNVFDFTIN